MRKDHKNLTHSTAYGAVSVHRILHTRALKMKPRNCSIHSNIKKNKYLGIHVTKEGESLNSENHKALLKGIEGDRHRREESPIHVWKT